jgi:hypothetical protein
VVVEVVVVALFGAGLGDAAAVVVEAWTSIRGASPFVVGPVGKIATGLTGAFWTESVGLELGAGAGELVCAWAMVTAANKTATAQMSDLKRLGINVNGS